jgi:hypothetical protein
MRALIVALVVLAPQFAIANPGAELDQGRIAYERGDYSTAVETIHPLLYPRITLASEESVIEAHRLLALSYLFLKKEDAAAEEVTAVLEMRPRFKLDPIVDPPKAVAFFDNVRKQQEDKLREIRERQRLEEERLRKEADARRLAERMFVSERKVIVNSRLVAALPFGIGQWQNRERKKAIFFGVSEATVGALSLATWIAINQLFPSAHFAPGQESLATGLTATQVTAGAVFWGLVAWGIIDAEVRFKPEIVVETRQMPLSPKAAPARPKATWAPILSPGFYGLGLQGAF